MTSSLLPHDIPSVVVLDTWYLDGPVTRIRGTDAGFQILTKENAPLKSGPQLQEIQDMIRTVSDYWRASGIATTPPQILLMLARRGYGYWSFALPPDQNPTFAKQVQAQTE